MKFIDIRPEDAFMFGYKPTCTSQKGNPRLKPWLDRLLAAGYPYVYPHNVLGDGYIFFHTEEAKQNYISLMDGIQINSTEYVRRLGHVLGFPRNSIDAFAKAWETEEKGLDAEHLYAEMIGVNMSGFMFSAHIPHLIEDITWMWRTYSHPKAKEFPTIFDIPDGEIPLMHSDYANLTKLVEQLNKRLTVAR
jgi:hypothetical protein